MKYSACIDTNFISYAARFELQDISLWLDALYDEIIVVPKVLEELLYPADKAYCNRMIKSGYWTFIDPLRDLGNQFLLHYQQVQRDFVYFQADRNYKQTSDKADIQILAVCLTLDLPLITSNDNDFKAVIKQFDYRVAVCKDLEADEEPIRVDGLSEFVLKCKELDIAKHSLIKKFVNASAPTRQKSKILSALED